MHCSASQFSMKLRQLTLISVQLFYKMISFFEALIVSVDTIKD
jgi:hypothetical protein